MGLIRSLDAAPVEAARGYFKPLHQIDLQERLSERQESEVQNKAARLTDIERGRLYYRENHHYETENIHTTIIDN